MIIYSKIKYIILLMSYGVKIFKVKDTNINKLKEVKYKT
jgi:hypothetical protein